MFDFLFGGKKKIELIRELLEQRMRDAGFDDMSCRLKVKQLGNLQLIGTPEGTIVTIIESVLKLQSQGAMISSILQSVEGHRRRISHDPKMFSEILAYANKSPSEAGMAIPIYARYRVDIEYPNIFTNEQFENAFSRATDALTR